MIQLTGKMLDAALKAYDNGGVHPFALKEALEEALRVAYDVESEKLREMAGDLLTEANRREQA